MNGNVMDTKPVIVNEAPQKNWKKFLIGLVPLVLYVGCGVTEGQITNMLFAPHEGSISYFSAPFLYVWLKSFIRIFMWILGAMLAAIVRATKGKSLDFATYRRKCENVTGPKGLTAGVVLRRYIPTAVILLTFQSGFSFSLRYLAPSVSMAIFTSTVAFSYLLSVVFLKHRIYVVKLTFVLASFTGVALIAYTNIASSSQEENPLASGHNSSQNQTVKTPEPANQSYIGIISIIIAALCLAIHQILYSRAFVTKAGLSLAQATFVLSIMGAINAIIFWPVPLVLALTGLEYSDFANLDWGALIGCLICSFLIGFVYGYGMGITSPFFMSLGELLNLGVNTTIDILTKPNLVVTTFQFAGLVIVAISFLVLILPDDLVSLPVRRKVKQEEEKETIKQQSLSPAQIGQETTI